MNQHTHYIEEAWTRAPVTPPERQRALIERIRALLKRERAVLIAHYYVAAELQELAEQTGGCVADSLEMARFGRDSPARTLMVIGVRFMGETAKILSPDKRVLMPDRCVWRLARCASRPNGGGVRQYLRRSQSARRLGGHFIGWTGYCCIPARARRKNPVGARPASGPLHSTENRRRYAALEGCMYRT